MKTNLERLQQMSPEQRALLLRKLQQMQVQQAAPAWSPLTPLQLNPGAPTIYFVHPAGGALFWYLGLLKYLGADINALGLQGHGLYGDQAPLSTIPEMAQSYVEAIMAQNPTGPYTLAGYSIGGVIAFELAQQLQAKGGEMENLFLLDSYLYTKRLPYPGHDIADEDERFLVRMLAALPQGQSRQLHRHLRRMPDHKTRIDYLYESGRKIGRIPPNYTLDGLRRMYEVMDTHVDALALYQAHSYWGPATFLRCEERSESDIMPYESWSTVVRGAFSSYDVPGKHSTLMEEPNVQAVARILQMCLPEKARVS